VLVDAQGVPVVLDVGIASEVEVSEETGRRADERIAGTPSYMAPERIEGAPPSVETDLYAVGVMLYQSLCGEIPHEATPRAVMFARRRSEAVPSVRSRAPDVPNDAAGLIDSLLARDPRQRPASAYDAIDRLERRRPSRPGEPGFRWLGTRDLVDALVCA